MIGDRLPDLETDTDSLLTTIHAIEVGVDAWQDSASVRPSVWPPDSVADQLQGEFSSYHNEDQLHRNQNRKSLTWLSTNQAVVVATVVAAVVSAVAWFFCNPK